MEVLWVLYLTVYKFKLYDTRSPNVLRIEEMLICKWSLKNYLLMGIGSPKIIVETQRIV